MTPDPRQQEVIDAPAEARQLVLAGPGTGKTETVARRIVRLLKQGVRPRDLLVLSFSRSAVSTLIRRIEVVSSENSAALDDLRHVSVRTFDSWTFRALRQMGQKPADLLSRGYNRNIALLVAQLRNAQGKEIETFPSSIRHVIVDELQDLSGVRSALVLELLARLAPPGKKGAGFTILGDEAQSIYGFSLDDEENSEFAQLTAARLIKEVRKQYKTELKQTELEKNHRSVPKITNLTVKLRKILQSDASDEKKLEAVQKEIEKLPAYDKMGVEDVASLLRKGSMAILTRTNGEAIRVASRILGTTTESAAIELSLRTTNRVKTVPAWLGATLGPLQDTSVTRSKFGQIYGHLYGGDKAALYGGMSIPTCDVAWSTLSRWTDGAPDSKQVDLVKLRARLDWVDQIPDDQVAEFGGLHIMTIHQSKGQEFDTVLILDDWKSEDADAKRDPGEDANVNYVAISRPKIEVARMGRDAIYAIQPYTFSKGARRRWTSWKHGWVNIELGLPGDVDAAGFVDTKLHDSPEKVAKLQELLAKKGQTLLGRKVVLCKHESAPGSGRFVYRIHLQEGKEPAQLLGVTREQVTFDLLHLIHGHGYPLPQRIFNLRIASVSTMTFAGELPATVAPTWATSGLWLGVILQGTGDFMTKKKK